MDCLVYNKKKVLRLSKQRGTHVIPTPELDFGFFGGDAAVAAVEIFLLEKLI